jgi:hypothetical protein
MVFTISAFFLTAMIFRTYFFSSFSRYFTRFCIFLSNSFAFSNSDLLSLIWLMEFTGRNLAYFVWTELDMSGPGLSDLFL